MTTSRPAVLFDIDGTLVDSNYLHVHAWQRAFTDMDLPVPAWRIHRCIGMDGAQLVDTLSGGAPEPIQKQLKDLHTRNYESDAALLTVLPGARELLARVAELGLQVVLATSAPDNELVLLRSTLDCDDLVSAITSSADVETAKPRPDIVKVALDKAGVGAQHAVFVGDTVWDVEAAGRADVACIGVLSGGISRAELDTAGAAAVYEDAEHLLAGMGDSPLSTLLAHEVLP